MESSNGFINIQPISYVKTPINNNKDELKKKIMCSNLYKIDKEAIKKFKQRLNNGILKNNTTSIKQIELNANELSGEVSIDKTELVEPSADRSVSVDDVDQVFMQPKLKH